MTPLEDAPKPVSRPSDSKTLEKVQARLEQNQKEDGVSAPSEITQALADVADVSNDDEEPSGFFGKYIKKHHDMKKKAEAEVLAEQKAAKERMIEVMKEKIAYTAEPTFQGTAVVIPKPQKKKRLGLFEKMQNKIIDEEEKKKETVIS